MMAYSFFLLGAYSLNVTLLPSTGLPPLSRALYSSAYSQTHEFLVIFGGINNIILLNDL